MSPSNAAEIQVAREQERAELQDLNDRAESVFRNYRQRMADPDVQKEQMQMYIKQLLTVYNLLKAKVTDQHQVLSEQDEVIKRLGVTKSELLAKLELAQKDIADEKQRVAAAKAETVTVQSQLSAVKADAARIAAAEAAARADVAAERELVARLRRDLADARAALEAANARAASAEINVKDVMDRSQRVISDYKQSVDELKRELENGGPGEAAQAAAVRMHEELWASVAANAAEQERLREEMIAQLTRQRNDEIAGYRNQLETMGHDLEEYRNKLTAEQNDSRKLLAEYEKCVAAIRTLEGEKKELLHKYAADVDLLKQRLREQAADLAAKHELDVRRLAAELEQEQLAQQQLADAHAADMLKERAGHQAAVAERNEKIRQMKHAFIQKLHEFEELHAPKVSLALQIQTYESIVAAEEQRLGVAGFALGPGSPRSALGRAVAAFRSPVQAVAPPLGAGTGAATPARAAAGATSGGLFSSITGFLSRTPAAGAAAPAAGADAQTVSRKLDSDFTASSTTTTTVSTATAETAAPRRPAGGRKSVAPSASADEPAATPASRRSRRRTEADALLEDTEVQLPPASAARRRTRSQLRDDAATTTTTMTTTLSSVTEEEGFASSLMISGRDALGEYVRLANRSEDTVPLTGWALRTTKRQHTLAFPAGASLAPEETFTVRTSADGEPPAGVAPQEGTVWVRADVWDPTGDECLLLNADNEVKARVVVRVGARRGDANGSCNIM
jgi:hypothetical protein